MRGGDKHFSMQDGFATLSRAVNSSLPPPLTVSLFLSPVLPLPPSPSLSLPLSSPPLLPLSPSLSPLLPLSLSVPVCLHF